jgi:hypothetical protein
VTPSEFGITPHFAAGQPVTIGYSLQSYFNTCSPNNPGCVTGGNCQDCAYNNNGHTQPYYAIDGQLITYYTLPSGIRSIAASGISIRPNPGQGLYTLHVGSAGADCSVTVYDYLGTAVMQKPIYATETQLNLQYVPQGIYIVKVCDSRSAQTLKVVKE